MTSDAWRALKPVYIKSNTRLINTSNALGSARIKNLTSKICIYEKQMHIKYALGFPRIKVLKCNYYHHQSVLPKGRSYTASAGTQGCSSAENKSSTENSGTKTAVLPGIE